MQTITTIGLDIAKSVFQVHGVDNDGKVVIRRQLKRRYVLAFFEKLPQTHDRRSAGSKERQSQLEQFERDESGPCGAGDEADWNGRDDKHVPHDLHPKKLEGALARMRQSP